MHVKNTVVAVAATLVIAATATAQRIAADLTGNWLFSVVTENGTGTPAVTLKQTGDSLTGTYESARMGVLALKGKVKDKTFDFVINTDGGATLTFKGTIEDADRLKGDVDFGGMGGATFTATRKKSAG